MEDLRLQLVRPWHDGHELRQHKDHNKQNSTEEHLLQVTNN